MVFTTKTLIGDILDNPKAREALDRAIPSASENPFINAVRHLSVYYIDCFAPGKIRKEEIQALEKEFEQLGDV